MWFCTEDKKELVCWLYTLGILYSGLACAHKEEQVCPHLQEQASATYRLDYSSEGGILCFSIEKISKSQAAQVNEYTWTNARSTASVLMCWSWVQMVGHRNIARPLKSGSRCPGYSSSEAYFCVQENIRVIKKGIEFCPVWTLRVLFFSELKKNWLSLFTKNNQIFADNNESYSQCLRSVFPLVSWGFPCEVLFAYSRLLCYRYRAKKMK